MDKKMEVSDEMAVLGIREDGGAGRFFKRLIDKAGLTKHGYIGARNHLCDIISAEVEDVGHSATQAFVAYCERHGLYICEQAAHYLMDRLRIQARISHEIVAT